MRNTPELPNPIEDEVENGKFKHSVVKVRFRGQELPSHFVITYIGRGKPKEDEEIGYTRLGAKLYWSQNQVISRG